MGNAEAGGVDGDFDVDLGGEDVEESRSIFDCFKTHNPLSMN